MALFKSFFSRLWAARAGNVLLITAVSMIPLMLIVSGGVDMGRTYLAREQLQGACDAAVLAARKAQIGFRLSDAAQQTGQRFFQINFPTGIFGTRNTRFDMTLGTDGRVSGKATAATGDPVFPGLITAPTSLYVSCAANLEMGNTDVVFALDVTGSMDERNPGDPQSRMDSMKASVQLFTDMLRGQVTGDMRVRFGFVPFNSTVNVGFLLRPEWIVDAWTYQSRIATGLAPGTVRSTFTPEVYGSGSKTTSTYEAPSYRVPLTEITDPNDQVRCVNDPVARMDIVTETSSWSQVPGPDGRLIWRRTVSVIMNGVFYYVDTSTMRCLITKTTYTDYTLVKHESLPFGADPSMFAGNVYNWVYRPVLFNVASVKRRRHQLVAREFANDQTDVTIKWDGCIEERDTVRTDDFSTIPANAYDLDIDRIPDSDATRWRPFLPALVYWRRSKDDWQVDPWATAGDTVRPVDYAQGLAAACPPRSQKLSVMNQDDVLNYVNSLRASGTTYLDIGMIWAARLASPTGLFAAENATAPNGNPINRNVIFMTDGAVETHDYIYEAYGLSALDRRRSDPGSAPSDAHTNALVESRFLAACTAAKAKGLTVWTIAFGTALTPTLRSCASNNHYFMANNKDELDAAFSAIAGNIARLRLVK